MKTPEFMELVNIIPLYTIYIRQLPREGCSGDDHAIGSALHMHRNLLISVCVIVSFLASGCGDGREFKDPPPIELDPEMVEASRSDRFDDFRSMALEYRSARDSMHEFRRATGKQRMTTEQRIEYSKLYNQVSPLSAACVAYIEQDQWSESDREVLYFIMTTAPIDIIKQD